MELATWPMVALGIIGGICQVFAHILMWDDGRPDTETRVARYVTGTTIIWLAFSVGYVIDPTIHPVTGLGQIIGWSFLAVWGCYEFRRRMERRTAKDAAARLIGQLEKELGDDVPNADESDYS